MPRTRRTLAAIAVLAVAGAMIVLSGCGKRASSDAQKTSSERAPTPGPASGRSGPPQGTPGMLRPRPHERLTPEQAVAMQLENAWTAARAGDHELAMHLCEEIIAVDGSNRDALAVCAVAACELGQHDKAAGYAAVLDETRRARVAQTCAETGVEL